MSGKLHDHIPHARHRFALLAALTMSTILSGCGGDDPASPVPTPTPVPVATVSIAPIPEFITVGQSLTLAADVKAFDGTTLTRAVHWSSDNPVVASVTGSGVLTAHAPGLAAIRATSEGKSGIVSARIFSMAEVPAVEGIVPSHIVAGTAGPLQLRVVGSGFTERSRIHWNGVDRPTMFISTNELRTTLLTAEIDDVTSAALTVRTSAPGGGQSNTELFHVVEAPASAPTIAALAPARITVGWPLGFTLTITGTGFTARTVVRWEGVARGTEYVNSTTLRIAVAAADLRVAREVPLEVETPAPGGGRASTLFPVRAIPVESIDMNSPWGASWTWVNNALPLIAVPRSATGAQLTDRLAAWSSGNAAMATVVPVGDMTAYAYGVSRGATFVEAVVDGVSAQRPIVVHDAPAADVVFTGDLGEEQYIGIWRPSTGQAPQRLPIDLVAFEPSPSPTGTHIVFSGKPRGSGFEGNIDLYVTARDGSGLRRLTTDGAMDYQPSWSPDGTRIVFTSTRGGNRNVWVMNSDGTGVHPLTEAWPGTSPAGSGQSAGDAAWSPDGTRLVYGVSVNNKVSLWIMDADGTHKRPLTVAMEGSAYDPTWSANGELVAFRREFGSPTQIALTFVSAANGATAFPVLTTSPMSATPAFSFDGQWLLASNSPLSGVPVLYAVPLNAIGGPRVVLPAALGGARGARWMRRP